MACSRKLKLIWVDSSNLEYDTSTQSPAEYHKAWHEVCTADGILVPGGFGYRGTEGMIAAASWARKKKVPYLGICLGMQIAVIEYAREICGLPKAASKEWDPNTPDPVVIHMPEIDSTTMGASMRLGLRPTNFQADTEWSKLRALYTADETHSTANGATVDDSPSSSLGPTIHERHRHRYEVNPKYIEQLSSKGLHFIGKDDRGERMEILELREHPWFVGVQFHPEYLSRVLRPSKPYLGFVASSARCFEEVLRRREVVDGRE